MRKSIRLQGMAGAVTFAMIAAAGCSTDNPTTPFVDGTANGISVDLEGDGVIGFEELQVCKEWTDNSNSSPTDIEVTVADPGETGSTRTHTLAASECRVVAQFDGTTQHDRPADLATTETVPANATLDSIVVVTIDRTSGSTVTTIDVLLGTDTWSFDNADNKYGFLVTYWNTLRPPEGGEGCTPGYWKQSHHFDSWPMGEDGYTQGDLYDDVFGVTSTFGGTLLDALKRGGGKEIALGRHAVAALLNAASGGVNYAFTEEQVRQKVQNAYASGDFNGVKGELETENERGCPLN